MARPQPLSDIRDLLEVVKQERNEFTAGNVFALRREQPGTFNENMSLRVGSRTFKNFQLPDLRRIEKAFQTYSIIDVGGSEAVAEAAIIAYRNVKRLAARHRITGEHYDSFAIFVRSVGGIDREIPLSQVERVNLPERPVISIISDVAYANMLESLLHHGNIQGFLYHTSKMIKREFGKAIQVKFDFFAAPRLISGAKGGTLPRLQIANPGDLRGASKRPGRGKGKG